ncbi:hypothetical protein GEMRC1_003209 [Eukaryota sp. GEM-RC1]
MGPTLSQVLSAEPLFNRSRELESIALRIGAHGFEFSSDLKSHVDHFQWNFTAEGNYYVQRELYSYVSEDRLYSTDEEDLSKSPEELQVLCRAVLFGPQYYDAWTSTTSQLSSIKNDYLHRFSIPFTELLDRIRFFVFLSFILSLILLLFIICSVFLFYFALTPPTTESSHIKQRVVIDLVQILTRQYVLSLSIIGVLLTVFFVFGLMSIRNTSHISSEMNLAGQRLSQMQMSAAHTLLAISEPVNRQLYRNELVNCLDQLDSVNSRLVFGSDGKSGSAGRNSDQDFLMFAFDTDTNTSIGLSILLRQFLSLGYQFATAVEGLEFSFNSTFVTDILDLRSRLEEQMVESLSVYRDDALQLVGTHLLYIRVSFGVCVLATIFIFFSVFRKMIRRLKNEEAVTLTLLSNIPKSVIAEVPLIANYLIDRD